MKPIKGFEDYAITENGEVYSYKSSKWLKLRKHRDGYLVVHLRKDGKMYYKLVHRLVCETFIGEIPKGYEIDHIDTNRLNNNINNLRIVTRKENANNPLTLAKKIGNKNAIGNKANSKPIIIDNIEYNSGSEAARQLNIPKQTISYRLKSKNFPNYYYKGVN